MLIHYSVSFKNVSRLNSLKKIAFNETSNNINVDRFCLLTMLKVTFPAIVRLKIRVISVPVILSTNQNKMFDPDPNRVQPDTECGVKLFTRLLSKKRPSIVSLSPEIIPLSGPKPGNVVEINGESGTGKTIHLMELIAQTIIPTDFGGKGAAAIVIDTNSNFHVPYLMPRIIEKHIIHHRTSLCQSTDTEDLQAAVQNVEDIVLEAMKKIQLFKCYSSNEYGLTLVYITNYLTTNTSVSLLAVDSLSTFYWSEMAEREQPIRMDTYHHRKVQELRNLVNEFKLVAIYTRPADFGSNSMSQDALIDYKIQLTYMKTPNECRIARNHFAGQQSSRRFSINNFGINWISSSSQ